MTQPARVGLPCRYSPPQSLRLLPLPGGDSFSSVVARQGGMRNSSREILGATFRKCISGQTAFDADPQHC